MGVRNIVLIGETGVGKSSIVNSIVGRDVAKPSNDAENLMARCTMCYSLTFNSSTHIKVWETPGLEQGETKPVAVDPALKNIQELLKHLRTSEGVHLLILCTAAGRARNSLRRAYNAIYKEDCRKKVPIALVITKLENQYPNMHTWWTVNGSNLSQTYNLSFHAHACVTTVPHKYFATSTKTLRELVLHDMSAMAPHHDICLTTEDVARPKCNVISTWSRKSGFTTCKRTQDDALIIVIGPTGSGKSTFISKLSGDQVVISNNLKPCTQHVQAFAHMSKTKHIAVLDVPGFTESLFGNKRILSEITNWVTLSYEGKPPLVGILYLHPITQECTDTTPFLGLTTMTCGGKPKVLLVTTMWDTLPRGKDDVDAKAISEKLEQVWDPIVAKVVQYDNTHESAEDIVQQLLSGNGE